MYSYEYHVKLYRDGELKDTITTETREQAKEVASLWWKSGTKTRRAVVTEHFVNEEGSDALFAMRPVDIAAYEYTWDNYALQGNCKVDGFDIITAESTTGESQRWTPSKKAWKILEHFVQDGRLYLSSEQLFTLMRDEVYG